MNHDRSASPDSTMHNLNVPRHPDRRSRPLPQLHQTRVCRRFLFGLASVAVIDRALPALGYTNVTQVKVGKSIRLFVDADDEAAAHAQVDEMCHRLLANPVIEAFAITLELA